jgi:aminoglycoside phosphotransferase (APT) family kinase protein
MEYLPGRPLDYQRDLNAAAALLARIHQVKVAAHQNHLIVEQAPLTLIYTECQKLLATYLASNLADGDISSYLREVLQWAEQKRALESYYQDDPWPCIINTEVNSGNFIVNSKRSTIHLVDWEMPRWGDPSQDLAHFCSPLTTLWKTSYRMTAKDRKAFITEYCRHIGDRHLRDTLAERLRLRNPFVYLRGISWSAMGWVAYQTQFDGVRNQDTWNTLQRYMKIDFIRSLFDPFLKNA